MFKNGEEVQQTVIMVFVNHMLAHFGEEGCLDAVGRDVPIKVASAGVSPKGTKQGVWRGGRSHETCCLEEVNQSDIVLHHSETDHRSWFTQRGLVHIQEIQWSTGCR